MHISMMYLNAELNTQTHTQIHTNWWWVNESHRNAVFGLLRSDGGFANPYSAI